MRRSGWAVLGAAATPLATAGVLAAEWKLAKRGPQLASTDFPDDGRVGGDGEPLRLVWLGDSLVTGAGASSLDATVPRRVARALDRPVEVNVRAIAGSRVRSVLEDQVPSVGALQPDAVVVCIGTNDVLYRTPVAEIRHDVPQLLAGLPAGVPVVVVGPTDFGAVVRLRQPLRALTALAGRRISRAMRAATEAAGGTYVDLVDAIGPSLRRAPDRLLAVDRFHPSDDGYRLVAQAILAVLRPTLAAGARPAAEVAHGDR